MDRENLGAVQITVKKLLLFVLFIVGIQILFTTFVMYERSEKFLVEEPLEPKVLSYSETYINALKEEHTLVFLEHDFNLDDSFEPLPKGEGRKILFGIHYSDLTPKKKSAEECPHYQEKVYILNGFPSDEPEDRYFFSSIEENTFHVANLSYFAFNARTKKVKTRLIQSFHPSSEYEHEYTEGYVPKNIHTFRLKNDKYVIDCMTGTYSYEASIRPELEGMSVLAGFMMHEGKGYFLKGVSMNGEWHIDANHYDRRFLRSLPKIRLTLTNFDNVWKINKTN